MRCLVIASVLAGIVAAHSQDNGQRRRKSLGFGPIHPHAVYHASPFQIKTNGFVGGQHACPHHTAKLFVEDLLGDKLSESYTYKIRKDSYTDKNTGISHIYVKQVVNGLEVHDGDMNINVKDGVVLSYGNSFYPGPPPAPFSSPDSEAVVHPHDDHCLSLSQALSSFGGDIYSSSNGGQVTLNNMKQDTALAIEQVSMQCSSIHIPHKFAAIHPHNDYADPRPALLQFMMAATPKDGLGETISEHYQEYLQKMQVVHDFAPSEDPYTAVVSGTPDAVSPVKAKLMYTQVLDKAGKDTKLSLVWKFEVEMQDNWYETAIAALPPHRIISVVDWASDSPLSAPASAPIPPRDPGIGAYNVFAWGINDPSDKSGKRTIEKENFDKLASPSGWHVLPASVDPAIRRITRGKPKEFWRTTTTTWGNNVFAQENWEGANDFIDNYRPDGGAEKSFDFVYNPQKTNKTEALVESQKHINATVAQLFYTSNLVHDLYYRYGFDEVSGNFQQYNFERGGAEGDAVIANAQDGSGYNNANFMTPPDGQNGRMRMYLWNTALPYRDGDFEAGIVIHELSHGLSTRLTGGPANSGCLGFGESGGMGEGWGDFLATSIRSTRNYSDYPMGAWAANRPGGIRNYPYSLNETINPSSYKTLDKPGYWGVHAIGEVWAELLWIVNYKLIEKHGYSDSLFPPQPLEDGTVPVGDFYRPRVGNKPLVPKHGNTLMVQLVLNGMKLQPCRPSFFDARDAIIQADQELTGGENFCELWNGFGERGLGVDATVVGRTPWGGGVRTNGFEVPTSCEGY